MAAKRENGDSETAKVHPKKCTHTSSKTQTMKLILAGKSIKKQSVVGDDN